MGDGSGVVDIVDGVPAGSLRAGFCVRHYGIGEGRGDLVRYWIRGLSQLYEYSVLQM